MVKRKALITGVTGQDGSYLAQYLNSLEYEVHGIIRKTTTPNTYIQDILKDDVTFHYGDVLDGNSIGKIVRDVHPDEIYNLAAQSHVGISFEVPEYTFATNAIGFLNILEAVRSVDPEIRVYQASTSEMFGGVTEVQNEETPFYPKSPYAIAKVAAHNLARNYRQSYGMFVSCGILFNHESPRRGEQFVTRKISKAIARMWAGKQETLELGDPTPCRDWGFAPDYVMAMHMMLQHDVPDDFVIATGEVHSVKEFVDLAFKVGGINPESRVHFDKKNARPSEVLKLRGDASKAKKELGWEPTVGFEELVRRMVTDDMHKEDIQDVGT